MTDAQAVAALPGSLPAGWQQVDVLVNNAGLAKGISPAQSATIEDWDTMLATNVAGLIHMTHALLPGMVSRDRGHIVNLSSTAALYPYPGGNVYGASKAFVTQFSLNLQKAAAVYAGTTPLTPQDIAEAVSWVVNLPAHMNVNRLELMPTCQAPGPLMINRRS